jgi:beta-lactam-binding protein with PASTA domain
MLRFFRLLAMFLVLVIVALASALISMRFAIHGREVAVPELRGMTPAEAERTAFERGLELSIGDRFYSATVPAGRIVSQQPEPGTRVRRGWRVQAAESLGPQLIDIPSLAGLSARAAEIEVRRRGLEPGDAAELPIDGFPPQTVLAQTPAAGAQGVAAPRVSLLYAASPPELAYAVPDLTGLSLSEATRLITAAGMKTALVTSAAVGNAPGTPGSRNADDRNHSAPSASSNLNSAIVLGQLPPAGSRVTPGCLITLQLGSSL